MYTEMFVLAGCNMDTAVYRSGLSSKKIAAGVHAEMAVCLEERNVKVDPKLINESFETIYRSSTAQ